MALPADNRRQKIIYKRLDLVRAENRHESRSIRRRARGNPVTRALGVGAAEPAWHLRAGKPATDRLDKGRAVEARLAQAWTGRKFAADATFARRAMALEASGLVPRCLTGREPRGILREGGGAKRHPDGQTEDRCSHGELRLHICLPAARGTLGDGAGPRNPLPTLPRERGRLARIPHPTLPRFRRPVGWGRRDARAPRRERRHRSPRWPL